MLDQLAAGGPMAQAAAKRLIADVAGRPPADCLEPTARLIADLRASAEGREGVGAFLEKRKPRWVRGKG
jgi:methylglutaconyl-CoA hydratase